MEFVGTIRLCQRALKAASKEMSGLTVDEVVEWVTYFLEELDGQFDGDDRDNMLRRLQIIIEKRLREGTW